VNVADQLREEGRRKGIAEGLAKGLAKGVAEGLAKGQRKVLLRQLRARFGALPEPVMARIRAADEAQLDAWADRVLTAPTLGAVLDGA
jgi:flagellar biosynthesis/type III secretory pathway protein FliH